MCIAQLRQAEQQRQRDTEHEVAGGGGKRITAAGASDRIDTPGNAGNRHERNAGQVGPGDRRHRERDEPAGSQEEACPRLHAGPLALLQPPRDHRQLHHPEQHQRTDRCPDPQVRKRERRGIGEERHRARQAAASPRCRVAELPGSEQRQHQRTGTEPDGGEGRGVQQAGAQRHAGEDGIGSKGDQRGQGESCRAAIEAGTQSAFAQAMTGSSHSRRGR